MKRTTIHSEETRELYQLSVLIKQVDNTIQKSRENELRKFGITPEQAAALICVRSLGDKATPAEISRWLFRDESSTLVLIRRMTKLGLINKTIDKNNKHLIKIQLSGKGSTAYENAVTLLSLQEIFKHLSKKKREQLSSLLEIVRSDGFKSLQLDMQTFSGLLSEDLILFDNNQNTDKDEK
jgi:DNA-binding MarR family transcriptional regulator